MRGASGCWEHALAQLLSLVGWMKMPPAVCKLKSCWLCFAAQTAGRGGAGGMLAFLSFQSMPCLPAAIASGSNYSKPSPAMLLVVVQGLLPTSVAHPPSAAAWQVGGASLKPEFVDIINSATTPKKA